MFAEYNNAFIKIPLFPIQSLYDSWSLPNILGIRCESGGSLSNCNDTEKTAINQYRLNTAAVLMAITNNKNNGCWAAACSNHVYSVGTAFYSPNFRVPAQSQFSIAYSVSQWMASNPNTEHIDSQPWPNNTPCSGVSIENLSI